VRRETMMTYEIDQATERHQFGRQAVGPKQAIVQHNRRTSAKAAAIDIQTQMVQPVRQNGEFLADDIRN